MPRSRSTFARWMIVVGSSMRRSVISMTICCGRTPAARIDSTNVVGLNDLCENDSGDMLTKMVEPLGTFETASMTLRMQSWSSS